MSWKRFTNPEFFGLLGKPLLVRLVQHFAPKFTDQAIELPDAALEQKEYFKKLATLGASKRGFPAKMSDVLYGIVSLGNEDGKNRLIHAATHMYILREFSQTGTCEDFALQFFLIAPGAFEKKVHEAQILARSSFQVFGSNNPSPEGTVFPPPSQEQLRLLKADVDEWVAQEYRGEERATQIENYEMEDEHLFLIRISDSTSRQAVVEGNDFTYQHFRPARDLVITYAAARDEVRITRSGFGCRNVTVFPYGQWWGGTRLEGANLNSAICGASWPARMCLHGRAKAPRLPRNTRNSESRCAARIPTA